MPIDTLHYSCLIRLTSATITIILAEPEIG